MGKTRLRYCKSKHKALRTVRQEKTVSYQVWRPACQADEAEGLNHGHQNVDVLVAMKRFGLQFSGRRC